MHQFARRRFWLEVRIRLPPVNRKNEHMKKIVVATTQDHTYIFKTRLHNADYMNKDPRSPVAQQDMSPSIRQEARRHQALRPSSDNMAARRVSHARPSRRSSLQPTGI